MSGHDAMDRLLRARGAEFASVEGVGEQLHKRHVALGQRRIAWHDQP